MRAIGILCAIIGVGLLLMPSPSAVNNDEVSVAFDRYEAMWRYSAQQAADSLEGGDLTSDVDVREFLSESSKVARKSAFQKIAKREHQALGDGQWTAEKHAAILRSYAK